MVDGALEMVVGATDDLVSVKLLVECDDEGVLVVVGVDNENEVVEFRPIDEDEYVLEAVDVRKENDVLEFRVAAEEEGRTLYPELVVLTRAGVVEE